VERALTTVRFDEQSRLTPEELQTVTFPMSRLGRRGYEEEPVHEFLSEVHTEFVHLVNERASLWQEVQRVRILSTAQVTADRYVADAQAYSSRVTEEARLRRDDIMREAQQHAEILLEDAHARAREAAVSALDVAAPPPSDRERGAAQAELAYLRTYSDVYRAHLRAYTEGVLRSIEEWEHKEAASLQEAAQWHTDRRSIGH